MPRVIHAVTGAAGSENGLHVSSALAILPVLDRVRALAWTRAVMNGMGPAVIGLLAVSLFRLAPYALLDRIAIPGR